ncbi:TldD/PmbA family protein [Methanothermobacter sp. THM-2]|uniref:TldD/PmbA family protein n=1 Tax=Methanothermobacter sp. THM-2 TaxID=2606912 RepID=UPI001365C1C1|nr:TldD/PmbA family protein [Methanothermobacter sp. THM-2]QHN07924.1 TldD/PmbA family protein [Methanothermobacter sp. THM-2]
MFDFAEKALKLALRNSEMAEVYIEREQTVEVQVQRDLIDFGKIESMTGIGIRVLKGGRMGFAYISDPSNLQRAVKMATENLRLADPDENFGFSEPASYPTVKGIFDSSFLELDVGESASIAEVMVDKTLDEGCRPTSGGVSASMAETFILNSEGVEASSRSTGFSAYISVNAEKNGSRTTAYESDSSCSMDIDPEWIAGRACRIARDSLGGENVESGRMSALLDYHAAAGLLGTFAAAFSADNVQRGRSILVDRIGTEVTSPDLNIYDDGTLRGGLGSSPFDGEGTPSQRTLLVADGVLEGYIHNIYTASKGACESTGNGLRSYSDIPLVSTTNFVLEFGDEVPVDDFSGIYVTDVLGAHTANPISGDFSVEANNAFLVNGGEFTPVKKAMLSGNIFELMKTVSSTDLERRQIGDFVTAPLIVEGIHVTG